MVHRNCYRPRQNAEKWVCLCENAPNFGFFQYILAKKAADKKSAAFVCMCLRNLCLKNQTVRFLRPLARRRASTLRPFLEAMRFKSHERGCADASSAGKSASFRIPSFKVSPILGIFGDLRLANARRYRGSLADFDYSARTASLSIANGEKSTRRSNARRKGLDFALCAGGPSGQIDANEPAVRCGFGGMLVQNLHFCHIFNFYCPYRGKLYPIIIVLGVNLCYTISVSLCLKSAERAFGPAFRGLTQRFWRTGKGNIFPAAAGCCMLRPPVQEF